MAQTEKIKYYAAENGIKMLPYIISYCKDFEITYKQYAELYNEGNKLVDIISTNEVENKKIEGEKFDIIHKILKATEKISEWRDELKKIHIKICSIDRGRLDIPIYDETLKCTIFLCINKDSKIETLEWHNVEENYENAHPYIAETAKIGNLIIPKKYKK